MVNRDRPRAVPLRLLALGLAVGLSGVLVGLSVAPRLLPDETFRTRFKVVAGTHVQPETVTSAVDQSRSAGVAHHEPGLPTVAAISCPFVVHVDGTDVARSDSRHGLAGRLGHTSGCRGPPLPGARR
jgi:hypothetical protein